MCFRPAEVSMKKCPNCGKTCKPVDKVCPDCGAELSSTPKGFDADQQGNPPAGAPSPAAPKAPGVPTVPGAPKPPAI